MWTIHHLPRWRREVYEGILRRDNHMVTIYVFGQTLLPCVEEPEIQCEVSEPITVRKLLESNPEKLGGLIEFMTKSELMVAVNQKVSTLESKVKDGDMIKLTHQFHPDHEGIFWHNP